MPAIPLAGIRHERNGHHAEPLLQAGILVSVIGYMAYLEPWTLVLCAAFLLPQMLFVPPMQQAINRRAGARITTLREVSGGIVDTGAPAEEGIEHVFTLNMGIYKIKYSMNMAMNLMYSLAVAVALGLPYLAASRSARWWRSCPGWASSTIRGAIL